MNGYFMLPSPSSAVIVCWSASELMRHNRTRFMHQPSTTLYRLSEHSTRLMSVVDSVASRKFAVWCAEQAQPLVQADAPETARIITLALAHYKGDLELSFVQQDRLRRDADIGRNKYHGYDPRCQLAYVAYYLTLALFTGDLGAAADAADSLATAFDKHHVKQPSEWPQTHSQRLADQEAFLNTLFI